MEVSAGGGGEGAGAPASHRELLHLRGFLDTVPAAVLVLTCAGRVAHANPRARALLALAPGAAPDTLAQRLGAAATQWLQRQLHGTPRGGPPSPHGPRVTLPGGRAAHLLLSGLGESHWALSIELPDEAVPARPSAECRRLLGEAPFPMLLLDRRFRIVDANAAFVALGGRAREHLVGLDPIVLMHPDDHVAVLERRRALEGPDGMDLPTAPWSARLIDAQGEPRFVHGASAVLHEGGSAWRLLWLQDVTAEHQARMRAERAAQELDEWFELSPNGLLLFDELGRVLRDNAALRALVGALPARLDDAPAELRALLGWQAGEAGGGLGGQQAPAPRQGWMRGADGRERALRVLLRCLAPRDGARRFMALVEDRSTEDALEHATTQLGALAETANAGLATFDCSSGRLRPREGAEPLEPLPSGELQGIGRELVLPQFLADFDRVQQALLHGERAEVRYAIAHPEHGERWLLTRAEPSRLRSGKLSATLVTLDVTELQRAQQDSERLLREIGDVLESSPTGIACLRGEAVVRCNSHFAAMLGCAPDALLGQRLSALFPEQPGLRRLAQPGEPGGTELEISRPDGVPRWFSLTLRRRSGGAADPPEHIAVLSDITRFKLQQAELEALARDRALMFNLSEVGIAFVRDARVQRANEAFAQLSGHAPAELVGLDPDQLLSGEGALLREARARALLRDSRWSGERQLRRKDGTLVRVQITKRLVDEGDPARGAIVSYVDVEARYRAEQALMQLADRTRAVLDSVLVGIVTVGEEGIRWMNRSARRMFAGDLPDFVGRPLGVVAGTQRPHPFLDTSLHRTLDAGSTHSFECRVLARDGRDFWVAGNVVRTGRREDDHELTYALMDIDRRRQAEERMAEAQASLQRLIELAPLGIIVRDARELRVQHINQAAADMIGRPLKTLRGTTVEDVYPPEIAQRYRADMEVALAADGVTQYEHRRQLHGRELVLDARYLPLARPGAAPDLLLLVATDVTEQRAAQQAQLEAALSQRDLLVREVHHRIKNNLQGVAGLLQQIAARKPEAAPAIGEVVGQVRAIAQVYGLQVGAVGPLRLQDVLEAITGSVGRTFDRPIALARQDEDDAGDEACGCRWMLPESEAIPVALTVNELLTNAVKHSAPGTAVSCVLRCDAEGVRIEVRNRGALPAGFRLDALRGGVSGLGLVRALLPRRHAQLALAQQGEDVEAVVRLVPPSVMRADAPAPADGALSRPVTISAPS